MMSFPRTRESIPMFGKCIPPFQGLDGLHVGVPINISPLRGCKGRLLRGTRNDRGEVLTLTVIPADAEMTSRGFFTITNQFPCQTCFNKYLTII